MSKYTLLELFGKHSSLLFAYRKIKLHFLLYFNKITLETWGFLQPLLMPATRNTKKIKKIILIQILSKFFITHEIDAFNVYVQFTLPISNQFHSISNFTFIILSIPSGLAGDLAPFG